MALGTSRPRNWGKETQSIALSILLEREHVAYQVRPVKTRLSGITCVNGHKGV